MTLVKICGVRDPETALAAARAGADFIGLVFAASKRQVTPQECHDVVEAVHGLRGRKTPAEFQGPVIGEVRGNSWFGAWADAIEQAIFLSRPLVVGVFADQPAREINDIAEAAGLDLVQLSGGEAADFARDIERPAIRTIHVADGMNAEDILERAVPGRGAALLLDTKVDGARGGTGSAFDWSVAAEVGAARPFLLAGGLSPENVAMAVEQVRPWAVDVSTGVETSGSKDADKIRAFIQAAKGAQVGR
jgi:phosphoribosylanthranilate isomerase